MTARGLAVTGSQNVIEPMLSMATTVSPLGAMATELMLTSAPLAMTDGASSFFKSYLLVESPFVQKIVVVELSGKNTNVLFSNSQLTLAISRPLSTSQKIKVRSPPAEEMVLPSGDNPTDQTSPVCP